MASRTVSYTGLTDEEIEAATPQELAKAFMPKARSMAEQWRPGDEDAVADAYEGLVVASHKWDKTRGSKFVSIATVWIMQYLDRGPSSQRDLIRLPTKVRSHLGDVIEARDALPQDASYAQIAAYMKDGTDETDVAFLLGIVRASVRTEDPVLNHSSSDDDDGAEFDIADNSNEQLLNDIAIADQVWERLDSYQLPDDLRAEIERTIDDNLPLSAMKKLQHSIQAHIRGETLL